MTTNTGPGAAFLLSQIGAEVSMRFADALTPLDLTPPQAGLLRLLAAAPEARSQQQLARDLGLAPSRMVAYLDGLEERGLVQRAPAADRRVNLVSLTTAGRRMLGQVGEVARAHETGVLAGLTASQRRELTRLLRSVADGLGVEPGVHPGYRR